MTRTSFTWHLHWPTTLFVFALLPCLFGLGFWQLHRADEKRLLQQQFDALLAAPPLDAMALSDAAAAYTRVQLVGVFDDAHSFLLDNRVSRGRVGYDVLTPFIPAGQPRTLFVNRGWIAGDPARLVRPVPPPVPGTVTL
ncbi:MAG: SURF1 family protein, partial [Spongiibacteraceae bacterium]